MDGRRKGVLSPRGPRREGLFAPAGPGPRKRRADLFMYGPKAHMVLITVTFLTTGFVFGLEAFEWWGIA